MIVAMKRSKFTLIATVAVVLCLIFSPACRKKHRVARTPNAPQPAGAPRSTSGSPSAKPLAVSIGYSEQGVASWYGIPYHGRPAADGEIYNMETLVAAHRLLPFNTWLKVTNLANGKTVDVRVIDRGPFVEGRILDLSKAAARRIDLLGPGIGQVRLEVISAPIDNPADDFYAVQIGAFSVYANAERARERYAEQFGGSQLALKQGTIPLWRVLVGREPSIQKARQLADTLSAQNRDVFVVRLDPAVSNSANPSRHAVPDRTAPPAQDTPSTPSPEAEPSAPPR